MHYNRYFPMQKILKIFPKTKGTADYFRKVEQTFTKVF